MRKNDFPKKAVILAGGKGTRLYPITERMPKPLLPVSGRPMINYQVDFFQKYGIKDIAVLINKEFKKDFSFWKKAYFSNKVRKISIKIIEEEKPLGTFGGLCLLKNWLGRENFFMVNADNLTTVNLKKMASLHKNFNPIATIALVRVKNSKDYGVVSCNSDIVEKFIEKPKNSALSYINSGLYLLSPEIFKYHSGPKFSMIEEDIFPKLAKNKKITGFKFSSKWTDCGTWERYIEVQKQWKP